MPKTSHQQTRSRVPRPPGEGHSTKDARGTDGSERRCAMYTINRVALANDWNTRRADGYDVVVLGSGYGGAVTAARLATAQWPNPKPTLCVLERGKEWLPGQFPDRLDRALTEGRSSLQPLGLYDFRFGPDI